MKAGIIAAGHGSRLAESHPGLIKPLIPVAGRPLCHWVAASLQQAGADEITLLHNSKGRAIRDSLKQAFPGVRWTFLQADTASSWESFRLVSRMIASASPHFLVSTVDSILAPNELLKFCSTMASFGAKAGLACTEFVDDEKPLWVDLDAHHAVTALGDRCTARRYVTSGVYYMTHEVANAMPAPDAYDSLRAYWSALLASGARLGGFPLSKTLDVDRPEDIAAAEAFLKGEIVSW
jgi:NDP-sugar pyrophosphorylase family protein